MPYRRALHKREAAPLRCKDVLSRASRGAHFGSRLARVARSCAPLRWMSLGRRRSARSYRACASRRAGCDRLMTYGRALHEREAAPLRCKAVLSRASRGAHFGSRLARVARLRATALDVSGEEAQRARARGYRACASRRAGCDRLMTYGRTLHEREAALLRWKAVLPCASRGVHFVSRLARVVRLCATALAVSGEKAQHGRLPRVRRAALAVVAPCHMEGHCTSERQPLFSARPCLTCQPRRPFREPACARSALARHRAGCLWEGGAARTLAARARRAERA